MLKQLWQSKSRLFKLRWASCSVLFAVCLVSFSLVLISGISGAKAQTSPQQPTPAQIDRFLPPPQVHPLPATLAQRQASGQQSGQQNGSLDDYFDQIQPTIAGYLVWSRFPVRIYVEPALEPVAGVPNRAQEWVAAVTEAIRDWNAYLPLAIVNSPDTADISILRRTPPLQVDRTANRQPEFRARSAETRFSLWVDRTIPEKPALSHRMTIWLGTSQTQNYLRAAARHELGHALGIWGHSSTATDVMYSAQVRQPPPISDRDINTLKHIYQQPTRLGWSIPRSPS